MLDDPNNGYVREFYFLGNTSVGFALLRYAIGLHVKKTGATFSPKTNLNLISHTFFHDLRQFES